MYLLVYVHYSHKSFCCEHISLYFRKYKMEDYLLLYLDPNTELKLAKWISVGIIFWGDCIQVQKQEHGSLLRRARTSNSFLGDSQVECFIRREEERRQSHCLQVTYLGLILKAMWCHWVIRKRGKCYILFSRQRNLTECVSYNKIYNC